MRKILLSVAVAAACAQASYAGVIDAANQAAAQQSWSAWGGSIGFVFNNDLLENLGVKVGNVSERTNQQDRRGHTWFAVRQTDGLRFNVANDSLQGFTGGSIQMRGGVVLNLRDGTTIDLRNLTLRPRAGDPRVLDLVGADGHAWLFSDRIMFELADNKHTLAVRAADVRMSDELASRIGAPEAAGWEIADFAMSTQVNIEGDNPTPDRVCTPYPWPNVLVPNGNGAKYEADLFMESFSVQTVGCMSCTGPNGSMQGIAGFAPSSTLINNKNQGTPVATIPGDPLGTSTALNTANIAWYTKFTGGPPSYNPPYKNDQHPFLIWNMYRVDADGSITQIGRSGVKHAFLTINAGCMDSCNDSHSLGLGCGDTYGVGNNDSPSDMGPRSEIVPAKATWGRCGSIFDPGCTGNEQNNGNNSWTQRLQVAEPELDVAEHPGATYKFESWYVARDDINIYNSMASIDVTPHYSGNQWTLNGGSGYRLGPAIDRWVDPTNPGANAMNSEVASPEGHAKVAVKVVDNGNGTWTYQYAVMNLDYARAVIQGAPANGGPDPRVLSNKGFRSFSVPVANATDVQSITFRDGSATLTGNWSGGRSGNAVTWSGRSRSSPTATLNPTTLDWGTLYSFSFVSSHAPVAGNATLAVAQAGSPASFTAATLVPAN